MAYRIKDNSNLQVQTKKALAQTPKKSIFQGALAQSVTSSLDNLSFGRDSLGGQIDFVVQQAMFEQTQPRFERPPPENTGSNQRRFRPQRLYGMPLDGTTQDDVREGVAEYFNSRVATGESYDVSTGESTAGTQPPQPITYNNDDFLTLPSSNRDFYLKKHGLTSLYPVIIASHAIDNSLETIKNFIDLNTVAKSKIEETARSEIAKFGFINDSEYRANMEKASDYNAKMFAAAAAKDLLLISLSPYTTLAGAPQAPVDVQIGRARYQFLGGKSIPEFLQTNNIRPEFTNTHVALSLAKNLASLLQFVQPVFVGAGTASLLTTSVAASGSLVGSPDAVVYDRLIPQNTEVFDFSNTSLPYVAKIISICTGDLQRQKQVYNIKSVSPDYSLGNDVELVLNISGSLLGVGETRSTETSLGIAYNINSVEEFINIDNADESFLSRAIIGSDNSTSANQFSILELNNNFSRAANKTGADYLVYDELSSELNQVNFDNLNNFFQRYQNFTRSIRNLVTKIVPVTLDERYKFIRKMCAGIADYFVEARLTTGTDDQGYNSGIRLYMFFLAAQNPEFATKLFDYMCYRYNNRSEVGERNANFTLRVDNVVALINNYKLSEINNPNFQYQANKYFNIQKDIGAASTSSEGDPTFTGFLSDCKNAMLVADDTSFDLFHKIAREVAGLTPGLLTNNETSSLSLGIQIHGRAYAIFSYFLSLLRTIRFNATGTDKKIFQYVFSTRQFDDLSNALRQAPYNTLITGPTEQIIYRDSYIQPLLDSVDNVDQLTLDIMSIFEKHAATIGIAAYTLNTTTNLASSAISSNNLNDKDTLLHSMQREQVYLKSYNLRMHNKVSTNVDYVPACDDYTQGQTENLKTFIDNGLLGTNNTKTNIISIGIPSGLLEDLRYRQALSYSQIRNAASANDIFEIVLTFEDMQTRQASMDELQEVRSVEKTYRFSSRLRVAEGSLDFNGADTKSSTITNVQQIIGNTTFIDLTSNDAQINYTLAANTFGSEVVLNEVKSHYASLLLKSTVGLDVSEQNFPVIQSNIDYPDANNGNYIVLQEDVNKTYITEEQESVIFATKVKRDLARSIYSAPRQLFENVVTSKTFEKIVNIIVDVDNAAESDPTSSVSIENVRAEIRLVR
jgi:hypothetical protein